MNFLPLKETFYQRVMDSASKIKTRALACSLFLVLLLTLPLSARDIYVTGTVTDRSGAPVSDATIGFTVNSVKFSASTSTSGYYSVRISGLYEDVKGGIQLGTPYPNPFTYYVNVPFILNNRGDVLCTVYSMSGIKVREMRFREVEAGSYILVWDGCNQSGSQLASGYYVFALTFGGTTRAGKLLKLKRDTPATVETGLLPFMSPSTPPEGETKTDRLNSITEVSHNDFYPVRLTDITLIQDTVIDFVLTEISSIPYKAIGDHINMYSDNEYRPLNLKGVNLGSSPPGTWPGEIAYAITESMYKEWVSRMAEAGFNSIRIYTLHPPVFYEKLAEYNQRHPDKPLLLFQGIWLDEVEDYSTAEGYDLIPRIPDFSSNIEEVVDCIHGNRNISFRYGKAYGNYETDISQWTAGFIIGREIAPQEVDSTNQLHPSLNDYSGYQFSITDASASDVFITRMLDKTVSYEHQRYELHRPVGISTWPTLDPLTHPTEIYTDEDKASIYVEKITGATLNAGMFISYHAYPYYPNFVSQEPAYQLFSDSFGPDSYLGYLTALKQHYNNIPLIIAEFGVPSSWGSAHQSFSNMHHGGYSEEQQGEIDVRLMNNIFDTDCAGGFVFAWMDEWFKNTWIVQYMEALNTLSGTTQIPTRQLWQNITSPEQNFGLIAFDQKEVLPYADYLNDNNSGPVSSVKATNSNEYFFVEITTSLPFTVGEKMLIAFDTYMKNVGESILPDGKSINNRSEFLLEITAGDDSAKFYVTQAYNMCGLTPSFDLADHNIQMFRTTITDGAPWNLMKWINDENEKTESVIGLLPIENTDAFSSGNRAVACWNQNKITIRIPWTMLYFYDPTQMKVINGAVTYDGGRSYVTESTLSDGIALSVSYKNSIINTTTRYIWDTWLVVPETIYREKKSLAVIEEGLKLIPDYAD